ncbi:MAG: hypothetical protein SFU21_13715 [Flavihumibacter sp.]|nr:hypothetical protein [Flavihumibacter sp.]
MIPAYSRFSTAVATLGSTAVTTGNKKNIYSICLQSICKLALILCCLFFYKPATAQKVFPVTKSALSGISIPEGSKQDKRMLMVGAAQLLLEMEAKDFGATIQNTEVLYLPLVAGNNYNIETFTTSATQAGWQLSPVEGTKEYFWLQQGQRVLMVYFAIQKKEINLYLADANGLNPQNNTTNPPIIDSAINNTNNPPLNDTTTINSNNNNNNNPPPPVVNTTTNPVVAGNYQFSTTNFDDGWTSTIHEDWVEVIKGNVKVLLHYPKEGTIIAADPEPVINNAWNILVAPRYTSLKNYKIISPSLDYQRAYFGGGDVTDANGNSFYVVLFRKATGWMEFIAPDKNSFVQQFGADADKMSWDTDGATFNAMKKMENYNRFAVAATDLLGKYTDKFASNTFYTNVYTGMSAGMSTYSSSQFFDFGAGQTYKWQLVAANSYGGRTSVASAKGAGSFTMLSNWKIEFSDIEGKPCRYDVYFSAIKGGRVLWMNNADVPGSGIFTGFSPSK